MIGEIALELKGISKRFPGVTALDSIDFSLYRGEVHALLGENGAGKSTLIKILSGTHAPDEGELLVNGASTAFESPKDARARGITLVPQDILMVPQLSIGRNILLGMEGFAARRGRLDRDERALIRGALSKMGVELDPEARVGALSVPVLRLAQIARALLSPGEVIVLDEPTAVLSEPDAAHLLAKLEALRGEGKALAYVTHRLSEVMRLADRITILRDGKRVGHFKRGEIGRDEIVQLMSKDGQASADDSVEASPEFAAVGSAPLLSVGNLSAGNRFQGVSIAARAGEIVGIAGVQGSGHGYLLRAIAGVDPVDEGQVIVSGEVLRTGTVGPAFERGMLFVPADRRGAGIVPRLSVRDNIAIGRRMRAACRRYGLRWPAAERRMTRGYIESLSVRPPSTEVHVGTLSGGNQQKIVLARALESHPAILLVEEPTQGIDVRTKAEIHGLLRDMARQRHCAVVVASSEFEELIGLADTIHVMRLGRLVQTLSGHNATYRQILGHALP